MYYQRDRPAYLARSRKGNRRNRKKIRDVIAELKKDVPCMDCGNKYPPYVMDFDHRPDSGKKHNIADLVKYCSVNKVLTEAKKCDIVCSNCHRIRTFKRKCKKEKISLENLNREQYNTYIIAG
jgi:hypothetical protein